MFIKRILSGFRTMYLGDSEEIYTMYKSIIRASEKCHTNLHPVHIDHAHVNRMRRVYAIIIDAHTDEISFINSDCALAILMDEMEDEK